MTFQDGHFCGGKRGVRGEIKRFKKRNKNQQEQQVTRGGGTDLG